MKNKLVILFIIGTFLISCFVENEESFGESNINTSKAYTIWWWQGNAVDTANIAYNLEMMNSAEIGGVHIIPIYGVKGEEDKFLEYMSPEWVDMLKYTSQKVKELGMEVSMTPGTGWCFGESWVENSDGIMNARIDKIDNCSANMTVDLTSRTNYPIDTVLHVMAECEDGKRIDLTSSVSEQKFLFLILYRKTLYIFYECSDQ